jgi:fumarylacetoacetase
MLEEGLQTKRTTRRAISRSRKPLLLSNGETRAWLEDGDSIILPGHCQQDGFRRIGFGECRGAVLAAMA